MPQRSTSTRQCRFCGCVRSSGAAESEQVRAVITYRGGQMPFGKRTAICSEPNVRLDSNAQNSRACDDTTRWCYEHLHVRRTCRNVAHAQRGLRWKKRWASHHFVVDTISTDGRRRQNDKNEGQQHAPVGVVAQFFHRGEIAATIPRGLSKAL